MATGSAERELVQLEKQYWQALKEKNVEAALRLTDDPCIVTGAQGIASIDRNTFKKMMTGAPWSSSTWVRRNGRWLCALHTEAIAGDPFGRDRLPAKRAD
jgi:hypothetical protein